MNLLLAALLLFQDPAVDRLLQKLRSDRIEERKDAREQLRKLGRKVIPALEKVAKGGDSNQAAEARDLIESILYRGKSGPQRIEQLRSSRAEESEQAKGILQEAGSYAEPLLLKALADPDPKLRRAALDVLGRLRSVAALAPAAKLFERDADAKVQEEAFQLLRALGSASESVFLAGLKNPQDSVRALSIAGLMEIKSEKALEPVAEIFMTQFDAETHGAALRYLGSRGLSAENALLRALSSPSQTVRVSAIRVLNEIGSKKGYERVSQAYREDKSWNVRRSCLAFFARLGLEADKDLILATQDENPDLRSCAALMLGDLRSRRAVPRLIDLLLGTDRTMKEAAELALASIGPEANEDLRKAIAAGRLTRQAAEAIQSSYVRAEVERHLEAQIGEEGSTGFFEGQLISLEALGRDKAVPVLIRILTEESYAFRGAHRYEESGSQGMFRASMKELAVRGLGELGGDAALAALKALAKREEGKRESFRLHEESMVALHRLGEKKPLEDHLAGARRKAAELLNAGNPDSTADGCHQLFSIGLLLTRLQRRDEALKTYHDILAVFEKENSPEARKQLEAVTTYNVACLHALAGDRSKGVQWLEKAVRAGFVDRKWILNDRDLDSLRTEEGYKKLLADDSLFRKRKDDD